MSYVPFIATEDGKKFYSAMREKKSPQNLLDDGDYYCYNGGYEWSQYITVEDADSLLSLFHAQEGIETHDYIVETDDFGMIFIHFEDSLPEILCYRDAENGGYFGWKVLPSMVVDLGY